MNNALIFAEPYEKSDTNLSSLNNGPTRNGMTTERVWHFIRAK